MQAKEVSVMDEGSITVATSSCMCEVRVSDLLDAMAERFMERVLAKEQAMTLPGPGEGESQG